jgi:hypothetical protein
MMGSTARRSQHLDGSTNDRLNLAIRYPQRGRSEASAESPHIVLGPRAPCIHLAAASFDRAYGYPSSVGGIPIVLPCPNVVLAAQAVLDGFATASFDVASPHYPRFDGRIPIAAACSLVVLGSNKRDPSRSSSCSRRALCDQTRSTPYPPLIAPHLLVPLHYADAPARPGTHFWVCPMKSSRD